MDEVSSTRLHSNEGSQRAAEKIDCSLTLAMRIGFRGLLAYQRAGAAGIKTGGRLTDTGTDGRASSSLVA